MPNIKSAAKRLRQTKKRTIINERWRRQVRAVVKIMRRHPSDENWRSAQKVLDRAARRGIIKKGKADRLKSRLARLLPNHAQKTQARD